MWKKVSLVLMTLFLATVGVMNCGNVSYAQKVRPGDFRTFPDMGLRKILKESLGKDEIEANNVKKIVVKSYDEEVNIESLKGLELFPNLEKLVIVDGEEEFSYTHNAENEAILNSLTHLKQFELENCTIKGEDIKLALPNLQILMLGSRDAGLNENHSSYRSLDVSQCPKLKKLNCWGVKTMADLVLPENGKLTFLACGENQLATIANLSKQTNLKVLGCAYTMISKLPLSKLTKLRELYCFKTKIKKLDVRKNKNLKVLDIDMGSTNKIVYSSQMPKDFLLQLNKAKKNRSIKNYLPKGYCYIETQDAGTSKKIKDGYNSTTSKLKKIGNTLVFKKKNRKMYVEFASRWWPWWDDNIRR